MKRSIALGALVLAILCASAGLAGAKTDPRAKAQSVAEQQVAGFLPSGPGQPGICDTKTFGDFIGSKKQIYLAACSSTDGTFRFFSIVNAVKGSLNIPTTQAFLGGQLSDVCNNAGGTATAVGVKTKFVDIFAGSGASESIASGFANTLKDQVKKTAGYVSFKAC